MRQWKHLFDGNIERKPGGTFFLTTIFKTRLAEEANPFIFAPHNQTAP